MIIEMNPLHQSPTNDANRPTSMSMQNVISTSWSDGALSNSAGDSNDDGPMAVNSQKLPYIFDDVAWHFNWTVFALELFTHVVPFGFSAFNYRAHGFIQENTFWAFFNTGSPIFAFLLLVAYFLCRDDEISIISQGFFLPVVLFFVHKFTVALKYACLSPTEYKRFNEEIDPAVVDIYQGQMQMFTGWFLRKKEVMHCEVAAAAVRIGSKIGDMYFALPDPSSDLHDKQQFSSWNKLLGFDDRNRVALKRSLTTRILNDEECQPSAEDDADMACQIQLQPNGTYVVSVYDTAMAIIELAGKDHFVPFSFISHERIIDVLRWIFIAIPFAEIVYAGEPLSFYSPWFFVFLVCSTYLIHSFGTVYFRLLFCVVFDVNRQAMVHALLRAMIRLTDLDPESRDILNGEESINPTKLSRDNVNAVFSISQGLRKTAKILGADVLESDDRASLSHPEFASPLDATKSEQLPRLCISIPQNIASWVYLRLILQDFGLRFRHRMDLHTVLAKDRTGTAFNCGFIQMLISITASWVYVIALYSAGASVNKTYDQQLYALAAQGLRLRHFKMMVQKELDALRSKMMVQKKGKHNGEKAAAAAEGDSLSSESDQRGYEEENEEEKKKKERALSQKVETLDNAFELLESCQGMIEVSNAQNAFKVMGIVADQSIVQYLLSSVISFYVAFFSLALPGFGNFIFMAHSESG